jgi:hypothetical protein
MFIDAFPVVHSDDLIVIGRWADGVLLCEIDEQKDSARRDRYVRESIDGIQAKQTS